MTPTIVFDFDGTLALGNGPIAAYARAVARAVGDDGFEPRARARVDAFESGAGEYRDAYDAVGSLAEAEGIAARVLESAYETSRTLLGTAEAPVVPPAGLTDFIGRVSGTARLLLATNAPSEGIRSVLDAWGIAGAFTALHFRIGKPAGLVPLISAARESGPVLSVGDIAEFDLLPAIELGAATALVGATAQRSQAPVTMRGATLADLYDDIESWAATIPPSIPS